MELSDEINYFLAALRSVLNEVSDSMKHCNEISDKINHCLQLLFREN